MHEGNHSCSDVMSCYVIIISYKPDCFLMRDGREGGEELGGLERGETIIRIYFEWKENLFSIKKIK